MDTKNQKKNKKCFCFYVLQNIFAIKNDTRIARVITFFPLFFRNAICERCYSAF